VQCLWLACWPASLTLIKWSFGRISRHASRAELTAYAWRALQMRSLSMGEPMPAIAERGPASTMGHVLSGAQVGFSTLH